jgi:hypothetical protein
MAVEYKVIGYPAISIMTGQMINNWMLSTMCASFSSKLHV